MSKISSFKRDWDGEPPTAPPTNPGVKAEDAQLSGASTKPAPAPKPGGSSRFATIMAALQSAGLENKASGKMTPTPEPSSSTSSSAGTMSSWAESRATSITSSAQSTSSALSKRPRDDEAEKSVKKRRGSGEKGVQMSLTVTEKNNGENQLVGTSKGNLVITLSYEQSQILKLVQEGKNIFFTGSAGAFISFE